MMKTRCPGQDLRFYNPDDVFEIKCSKCGYEIEFFKNDIKRNCPECGELIHNPELDLGCAKWCKKAEECLGVDPDSLENISEKTGSEPAFESFADFINKR